MNRKKWVVRSLMIALLLAAAALIWCLSRYVVVDLALYPRNAQRLDLREKEISLSHYEKLSRALPECEILWNVPFRNTAYPLDTKEITVTALTDGDVDALAYLTELETVRADRCRDYAQLERLREERPEVLVEYDVVFSDGTAFSWDAAEVTVSTVTEQDVRLLHWLPRLERVIVAGGGELESADAFRGTAHNLGLEFYVRIGEQRIPDTEQTVRLKGLTEEELPLLALLASMQTLHISAPAAAPEKILALREAYPGVEITWDVEIGGKVFEDSGTEVDLSAAVVEDLAELERQMAYLPEVEQLILGLCGVDDPSWDTGGNKTLAVCHIENEDLAAYRDRVRDRYKLVWTVRLGPDITLRTDASGFSPGKFGVDRLVTGHARNLRYCEDMVCLDLGGTRVSDIGFVSFMPRLKYLILSGTEVQYIEPIRSCKALVLLELDNSCIRDYSPLTDCTSLEDLNIGKNYCDLAPVLEMTWLNNLYMILDKGESAGPVAAALPDTNVVAAGSFAVSSGWRALQNHCDMGKWLDAAE